MKASYHGVKAATKSNSKVIYVSQIALGSDLGWKTHVYFLSPSFEPKRSLSISYLIRIRLSLD
jgi:hypothetical protein